MENLLSKMWWEKLKNGKVCWLRQKILPLEWKTWILYHYLLHRWKCYLFWGWPFFLPFGFMFYIYISISMEIHSIYAASESENSRYLDIYILIIYLNFSTFKDGKIISWGWSLLYIHPLVLQAAVCEEPWRGVGLMGCWHL